MSETKLKGNPVHLAGEFPRKGVKAPDFTLVKGDLSTLSLSELKGKTVVLNIFPSLDTSVCSTTVRRFNQLASGGTLHIARPTICTEPLLCGRGYQRCHHPFRLPSAFTLWTRLWRADDRRPPQWTLCPRHHSHRPRRYCHPHPIATRYHL